MALSGELFIGRTRIRTKAAFRGVDPATGASPEPPFFEAGGAEVERACALAASAFEPYRRLDVCYQDFPDALLPSELRRTAAPRLPHRLDGVYVSASSPREQTPGS